LTIHLHTFLHHIWLAGHHIASTCPDSLSRYNTASDITSLLCLLHILDLRTTFFYTALYISTYDLSASSLHSLLITAPYLISRSGPHYHQPSHRMTQHARTEVVQLKHCVPYLKWKTLAPNLLSQWLSHRLASETTELDVKRVPLPLVSQLDSGLGYKCFLSLWCAVMGRYI